MQGSEIDLPFVFTWNGKTLAGSRTATADSQALADAGIIQLYDVEIVVRTALFVGIPQPVKNEEVRIQNDVTKAFTTYRIDKITPSQDGVCLTLGCVQQN